MAADNIVEEIKTLKQEVSGLKQDILYIRNGVDQLHNLLLMSRHPHLIWEQKREGRFMTCKVCGESSAYVATLTEPADEFADDWVATKLNCVAK